MAIFHFETITEAQALAYRATVGGDAQADTLVFDNPAATATAVTARLVKIVGAADEEQIFIDITDHATGRTVRFGEGMVGETDFVFQDGSRLFLGDEPGGKLAGLGLADVFTAPDVPTTMFGFDGDDTLTGGTGADLLQGNVGNDVLTGGAGLDTLFGGKGDDVLNVGSGPNFAQGNIGNDTISASGSSESNTLLGGQGNDSIAGGVGKDYLGGGAGSDIFVISDGDSDLAADHDLIIDWESTDRFDFTNLAAGSTANYVEGSATDFASALAFATSHIQGGQVDYVVVQIGNDLVVFADTAADIILGDIDAGAPETAIVLAGRTLADISEANFI